MEKNSALLTEEDIKFSSWMREHYNKRATQTSGDNYEHYRWGLHDKKRKQYEFSRQSILFHLQDVNFKKGLEIGCGAGTWTKLLTEKYPAAKLTSLDLSKEMIKQLKQNVKSEKVKTITANFLEHEFKENFDFVFFSRAIEYIPNKPLVIKKMHELLTPQSKGIIITSPPHPFVFSIKKMLGKKTSKQHSQRVSVKEINKLLTQNGFTNIEFYPILFSDFSLVPRNLLFNTLYKKKWGLLSKMFASGYLVKFEKPKNEISKNSIPRK